MQRKALIATLLLPLPFAALPLVGVLLGMTGSSHTIVVDARQLEQRPLYHDVPSAVSSGLSSLAYGLSNPVENGCDASKDLRAES